MIVKLADKFKLKAVERKFNKLKRDPDLFLKDMVLNKKNQVQTTVNKIRPVKPETKFKYTIVSAVYNVSKYLDEYFESIVNQSVDFKKSIQIICVDDGSTDNSAEIIKKWQKKFPHNIQYIYKENGGQSSARNLGLEYVKTEWVTMIDPDDFLHPNFFREVDLTLKSNKNVRAIAPNFIFYFDDKKIKKDTHPLKYKFKNNSKKKCSDLDNYIHLHAASTIFNYNLIKKNKINFNSDIKPSFEDAKFISDYLLICQSAEIYFLNSAIYYYRKRSDNTSTLDQSWLKPEKYDNVLKFGHLDMLLAYKKKLGHIPKHIQRTALYDIAWYINFLLNRPEKTNFLSDQQKKNFLGLIYKIFSLIDTKTILSFDLAGVWFKHKVGMLGLFKSEKPDFQIVYIENVDRSKKQILISYFTYHDSCVSFKINGLDVIPRYFKKTRNDFMDETFLYENRVWLDFDNVNDSLEVSIDNKIAKISLFANQVNNIKFYKILEKFEPSLKYEDDGSWIFLDRDIKADDNAEHLYRFILKNNLKNDIFFAISNKSPDWNRLKNEGFNLLDFGSDEFESKLKKSSKIISSHLNGYVENYFGDFYEYSKKVVFLQHGITKDDLSSWFNTKKSLSCVITSTNDEYESLAKDENRYKLTEKEVVYTGFPRHDSLALSENIHENIILIMPTWRNNIVGTSKNGGDERELNINFMQSEYAQSWYNFLHSEYLKVAASKFNYKIIFAPHLMISPYLNDFNIPEYISSWEIANQAESIQDLFKRSSILITDYSSVAFEMAYLEKPIIYYQFDRQTIFRGDHTYQKGYFDYIDHGFGPVVERVDQVNIELAQILENNGQPLPMYLKRMQDTFKFKDGRCCERVYQAILDLDRKDEIFNVELAQRFLQQAYDVQDFPLVIERANNLLMREELTESQKVAIKHLLAEAYFNLQNFEALEDLLNEIHIEFYQLKLLAYQNKWADMLELLGSDAVIDQNMDVRISMLFNLKDFTDELAQYDALIHAQNDMPFEKYLLAQCYIHYVKQEWTLVSESIAEFKAYITENSIKIETYTQDDLTYMHMMADKYLNQIDINLLLKSKSHTLDFEIQKALTLSEYSKAKEACILFKKIESENGFDAFDHDVLHAYVTSLFQLKDWTHLKDLLDFALNAQLDLPEFTEYYIETLFNLKQYAAVVTFVQSTNFDAPQTQRHMIVLAHYRLGLIDEAYKLLIEPSIEFDYSYWILSLEIYMQTGHEQQVIDCVRRMYAIFPDKLKETKEKYDNLSKLLDLI